MTYEEFRDLLEIILNSSTDQHIRDKLTHIIGMYDKLPDVAAEIEKVIKPHLENGTTSDYLRGYRKACFMIDDKLKELSK